jgi:hypothetical protein
VIAAVVFGLGMWPLTFGHFDPGIAVGVDGSTGRLVVTSAVPLDDTAVIAAVDEAGYQAVRV